MLDVHPAHHAATSWKEFLVHIATIVLGLLIALGLEQIVERIHNRHELAETRHELEAERETNRRAVAANTKSWRWETVEMQNNLMVLSYLKSHPGTPEEQLPGGLIWSYVVEPHSEVAWGAARTTGVIKFMSNTEVERYEDAYNKLRQVDDAHLVAWNALTDAFRYQFTDSNLSHLKPAQIDDLIALMEKALDKQWQEGVALENLAAKYKDYAPSVTPLELSQAHNRPPLEEAIHNPAFAKSVKRMQAAGF